MLAALRSKISAKRLPLNTPLVRERRLQKFAYAKFSDFFLKASKRVKMDSSKDGKNVEPKPMEDVTIDFLPMWMNDINLCEEEHKTTEKASDDAAPKPAETDVPRKLNDTTKQDNNDNEVDSDEEPPPKKFKVTAMPIGMCSYKPCNLAFTRYCLTCQGFYCEAHASIEIHECIPVYSPPSSLSPIEEDE